MHKPHGCWSLDEIVKTSAGRVAAGRTGDGPDLVLAHGWPWSSFSWHRIIPELSKRYRVHWYDMPGYGQSEKKANQRTSLDVQGIVFAEMLTHWNLSRPTVVAHDFGGATTLRAHRLQGCDFEKYVLMNVVALRPWGSEFFDHVGRHVDAFAGFPSHIHKAVVEAYIQGILLFVWLRCSLVQRRWIEDGSSGRFSERRARRRRAVYDIHRRTAELGNGI